MLKKIRRKFNQKGFTLVELIVVIAVLGILAAVAVPRLTGVQDDAKKQVDEANIKMIQNAIEIYYAKYEEFPDEATEVGDFVEAYLNDSVPSPQVDTSNMFVLDTSTGSVTIQSDASGTNEIQIKAD